MIYHEADGDLTALAGARVAVVGYGNQGRSWALNLRDSGLDPLVCVRQDASREQAEQEGFAAADIAAASAADVICVLVPDDVIPSLPLEPKADACTIVASGYTLAFDRFTPDGDLGMVAPRMLGPEVRRCYEEGAGFITAVGVHRDVTGTALARVLAIAKAIGGLREGAIELTPRQEAVLDLGVEQVLSPALTAVNNAFVTTMLAHKIPLEAILVELVLSGEVERTYRLLREVGFAQQAEFHSPTSQYGQLSRRGRFDHLDVRTTMEELTADIESGAFADEWDAERDAGYPKLAALKAQHAGPDVAAFEADIRTKLGPGAGGRFASLTTTVYTDGACLGNPGPGGWAWAVPGGAHASGADPQTTNQRMEIRAALEAVESLPGALEVVSDSKYVVQCFTDRWFAKWEANGWKTSNRTPVLNQDLWRPLVAEFHERDGSLSFTWVKGHSGDVMNDVVDRLATEAARRQVGRAGSEPPVDLGAADEPTGTTAPAITADAPAGHRVVVIGHRPPDLGGYGDNPVATAVRTRLTEILEGLRAVHPDLVVLTGLGLGAEQLGAEAAAGAGVPYVAVLPFPDPDAVWPAPSRAAFRLLLDAAHARIIVSAKQPGTKQAAGIALGKRNSWLVANADAALVVWDGRDKTLRDDVRALERRIPDDVWLVPPERA